MKRKSNKGRHSDGHEDTTLTAHSKIINTNEAERQSMLEIGLKKYEYLATLDKVTCDACGALDGKVFDLDSATLGVNFPPMHEKCRCVIVCALTDQAKIGQKRFARDENGKAINVPITMKYPEWKSKFMKN